MSITTSNNITTEKRMGERDAAMLEHMDYIVRVEYRPFSYLDFESFQVNGRWYHIPHVSCRNKFSDLVKAGVIELEFNSKVAYQLSHYFITFLLINRF